MSSGVTSALPIRLPPVGMAAGGVEGVWGVRGMGSRAGATSCIATGAGAVGAAEGEEKNFFLKKLNMGPALEWLYSMKPRLAAGQRQCGSTLLFGGTIAT